MTETKCCGSIGYSDGKFTCSNGAIGVFDGDNGCLTVTLPGCRPFCVMEDRDLRAGFSEASAWVAMRAVNAVSPEVACSILDVPGGYAAVKLPE
jgi:hypothetical protein